MNNKDKKELKTNTHYKEEMIIPQNIPIILISSNEFIPHCATTMASILHNINKSYHISFYILSFDLTDKNKNKLEKLKQIASCDIFFPKLDDNLLERFDKIAIPAHVSKVCYLKIFIPDILPEANKAIFIDCDTICRDDISELYNINLGENYFGMVEGVGNEIVTKDLWGEAARDYFNSGVILINIQKLREDDYLMQIENRISKNIKKYQIADQDIINDSFRGNILRISARWNFFHEYHFLRPQYRPSDENDYKSALENPSIVHYVGKVKPWHQESRHPYKKEYIKYYKMNPFYSIKDELKQLKKIFYSKSIKDNVTTRKYLLGLYRTKISDEFKEKRLFGIRFYKKIKGNNEQINLKKQLAFYIEKYKAEENNIHQIVFNEVANILCIKNLHSKTFPAFKDIHYGKEIVIVGTGPTLNNYKIKEDAIHVGLNNAFKNQNIKFDYVFAWDYANLIKNDPMFYEKLSKYNCKKFFGLFLGADIPQVPKNIIEKCKAHTFYSSARHDLGFYNAINNNISDDIEISPLMDFMSVAFAAFHFSVYTNPKRIYLVGIDNALNGYFNGDSQQFLMTDIIKKGWETVKIYMDNKHPDIEIISINPVGLKGIFKDIYEEKMNETQDKNFSNI